MVEITGKVRKLHYEKLRDLYCSPNIIRAVKSIRKSGGTNWVGGKERCIQGFDEET